MMKSSDSQELVGTNPEKRNWKGIIIAVLVILFVFALITVAVVLVTPEKDDGVLGIPFKFEDMFSEDFKARKFDGQWISNENLFVYRTREGEIFQYDVSQKKASLVMDNSTFRQLNTDIYFVSPDRQFVLVPHNIEKVFRHSYLAEYKIYDRNAKHPSQKLLQFPHSTDGSWDGKKLQLASWSTEGQALTFVYGNNLYYQASALDTPVQLTTTGSDTVYNGRTDWLYEEEMFHSSVSHWFSPGSSHICYAEIDDSLVPEYVFPWYGNPSEMNATFRSVRYPKAGESGKITPVIKLYVLPVSSPSKRTELQAPQHWQNQEYYVTMVKWLSDVTVLVVWSNRPQNHSIITLCNSADNFACFTNLEQKSTGGWVEIPQVLSVMNGQKYLTLLPELDYDRVYYRHLALVDTPRNTSGMKLFITQGSFDVTDILAYDETINTVYFISTNKNPRQRHLFSITIPKATEKPGEGECLTCDYKQQCRYVTASFSHDAQHYMLHCLGPGVPVTVLRNTSHHNTEQILEQNSELQLKLEKIGEPHEKHIEIVSDEGEAIWIRMLLPPVLKEDHITLYPTLVHTYGGPGSQQITDRFELGWGRYLATYHNVIYVSVDGRGSGGQGQKVLHSTYKRLGTGEVQDQLTAAAFLRDEFPFVDKDRMAIWGWSYGGFVTAHALADRDNQVFQCGIAVAPVTDWRYYNTAYTERYMGLATESVNYKQYDNANVSAKAEYFNNKKFMVVHGTADDNVHYQHTAHLIKALTAAGVDFRAQVYTDQNHDLSLSGESTQRHLYQTTTKFLRQSCWKGGNPREWRGGDYVDVNLAELAIR